MLIVVGLAGLLGDVSGPRWDGPLHRDAVAVGLVLELVLGVMLAITIRRLVTRARAGTSGATPAGVTSADAASTSAVAVKLRWALVLLAGAGMIAIAATMLVGVHQHLFSGSASGRSGQVGGAARTGGAAPAPPATRPGRHFTLFALHLHVPAALLYGLLALTFLGVVAVRVWLVPQFRSGRRLRTYNYLAKDPQDPQDLWEAVQAGRSALHAIDDARAAIIACYLAMEASLAEHGTARASADTPDELLRRAMDTGIVRGTAAARLTALFYEARFSSHPLDRGQRAAAGQALTELVAALAETEAARNLAARSLARRRRAQRTGARA